MSVARYFYEPFYSLSDFDRLFDEAFNARSPRNGGGQQVQQRDGTTASTVFRPR
jgi:hypothetical protein